MVSSSIINLLSDWMAGFLCHLHNYKQQCGNKLTSVLQLTLVKLINIKKGDVMSQVNMSYEDSKLLDRLSGKDFPYAEALVKVDVPIKAILLDRVPDSKYGTTLRTTRNGKSTYTHKAVILHSDPRCPEILKDINSIGMLDWQVSPIVNNFELTEASLPTMTRAMKLPTGEYDCAMLTISVLQRIVGQSYQARDGEIFVPQPSTDGSTRIGDTRVYFDIDPVDSLVLPNYVQQARIQAMVTASAEASQRIIEENTRKQQTARVEIPRIKLSDAEIEARGKLVTIKNSIAEHNALLDELKAKSENNKLSDDKLKAAKDKYAQALEVSKDYELQLSQAQAELDSIE